MRWRSIGLGLLVLAAASARAEIPTVVYGYHFSSSAAEREMMASLQGIVAQRSPRIYLGDSMWIGELLHKFPQVSVQYHSAAWFVQTFRDYCTGYVLYDDASRNAANSVAGVARALMVDSSMEPLAIAAGLPRVADVRGKSNLWVWNNYGDLFNRDYLFHNGPDVTHHMRDLVAYKRGFIFYEDAEWPTYYAAQNDNSWVFGWAESEYDFFSRGSTNNLMNVAANWLENGSVLSQWQVPRAPQQTHVPAAIETPADAHFVAFVMSDGDNVQWLNGGFYWEQWWGSPERGRFTMNWDIAPVFADINPLGFSYYYETAAHDEFRDFFINANGPGTIYPGQYPALDTFSVLNGDAMAATDQNVMAVLAAEYDPAAWQTLVSDPRVLGLMVKWGGAYKGLNGAIHWFDGKPCIGVKYSLWDGFDTPAGLVSALNSAPRSPRTDPASYSVVNVHPWSTGFEGDPMRNVKYIVDRLDPHVRVVTLEELIIHLRNNFGRPVFTDCNANGVRDGDEVADRRAEFFTGVPTTDFQLNGAATVDGGVLTLTPPENDRIGSAVWVTPSPEPVSSLEVQFDFRIGDGTGADGFSFALLDAALYGPAALFGEQGPGAGALALEFDTFDNGSESDNHLDLWKEGVSCGRVTPSFDLDDGLWHSVRLRLADGRLTVELEPRRGVWETVYDQIEVPGFVPTIMRYGFGARTGGANNAHQIDGFRVLQHLAADANGNGVLDSCEGGADLNHDGQVDGHDTRWLLVCLRGPDAPPACSGAPAALADFDADGDVDLQDLAAYQVFYVSTSDGDPNNWIANPGAEEPGGDGLGPANWFHSLAMTEWATDAWVSPVHALQIDDTRTDQRGEWRCRGVLLPAGARQLDFSWYQRRVDIVGDFEAAIRFFDTVDEYGNAAGTFHGELATPIDDGTDTTWSQHALRVSVPAGAGSFDVVFRSLGGRGVPVTGATGRMWIDDVVVSPD